MTFEDIAKSLIEADKKRVRPHNATEGSLRIDFERLLKRILEVGVE